MSAPRLLIIDDSALVATSTARLLELEGYRVEVAHDGASGLALLADRAGELEVVILDMVLPDLNGLEVLSRLRGLRADLPVVLTSGYAEPGAGEGPEPGVVFLGKPFTIDELLAALRRARG